MKNVGLYVHIPFCVRKCNYCNFYSVSERHQAASYFLALEQEMERYSGGEFCIDTIYFGGGTPTSVDTRFICNFLEFVYKNFTVDKSAEITVECNPKTIDFTGFCELVNASVNRISIGLQSTFNDDLLLLGRVHMFEDFIKCYGYARRAGLLNISTDLMFGLPNQDLSKWSHVLKTVTGLGVEHISAYALKIEEGTPFHNMDLRLPDEDMICDMYEMCVRALEENGYKRYEISNFATKGKESRHNLKYWEYDEYIGIGAASHSCFNGKRYGNTANIQEYIKRISSGESGREFECDLSIVEQMSEYMFLGLRLEEGVSRWNFSERFGADLSDIYGDVIKRLAGIGAIITDEKGVRISKDKFFVSNSIMSEFLI